MTESLNNTIRQGLCSRRRLIASEMKLSVIRHGESSLLDIVSHLVAERIEVQRKILGWILFSHIELNTVSVSKGRGSNAISCKITR